MKKSLLDSGPKANLYITSTDFAPDHGKVLHAPHITLDQEGGDLMVQRLISGPFAIDDVLFMSALQVAREIACQRGRTQQVFMVGFDFQADLGYAKFDGKHYESDNQSAKRMRIDIQENFLLNALYTLQGSNIEIIHVGNRVYSKRTPDDLVAEFVPFFKSDVKKWNVSIVAEITTNHFGDRTRLERMVRAARAAGADFVKVQKRDVETFYTKTQLQSPYKSPFGTTFADYRHQLELTGEDFEYLDSLCTRLGIGWFASLLDEPSYRFVMDFKPPLVKLPSTISEHTDYLSHVASTCDRGIVLSTGMTDRSYEKWVLETFAAAPSLYLMQANSAYPTPPSDCNIGVIRHYDRLSKANPKVIPAYSSHDPGWIGSAMAVSAGARMVEKHVKLGNTDWAHFDAVALDLTTTEFKDYVGKIRDAEVIVGSEEKTVAPSEHHKYRKVEVST